MGDAFGVLVSAGVAVGLEVGVDDGVDVDAGFADAVAVAVELGVAVRRGVAVACAMEATGAGVSVCITASGVLLCTGAGTCRAANAERRAPIPKPAMMTPAKSGTIGKPPRSSSSLEERRLRGEPDPELISSQRSTREGLALDGRTRSEANRQAA
ncbi:MAG: hypothetical protein ABSE64_05280 [Vulcanimicrobiaceae bacterium]